MYQDRGPPRGGTRGGRDQFSWENVKSSRDRDYYLGHSEKALTGRWQKGRDVYWYTRDVERGEADAASELAAVKQREQDLMMEALGVRPRAPKAELRPAQLDKADMQKLLQGGEDEGGAIGTAAVVAEADRVKGLGFHASMTTGAIQAGGDRETLGGVGGAPAPSATQRQQQVEAPQQPTGGSGGAALTAEQIAEAKRLKRKQEKKAAKRARKEAKKAKKSKKKEKRKRRSHSGSSGSSSESGSDAEGQVAAARKFLAEHGLSPRRGLGGEQAAAAVERERRRHHSPEPRRERQRSRSPVRRHYDSPRSRRN